MSNWRIEIKDLFEEKVAIALSPEIQKFSSWNNQIQNSDGEETLPELSVFFHYILVGDGGEYLNINNIQQSQMIPVQCTLHIVFNNYNEYTQNCAYDYAWKIICEVQGIKHPLINGRILKVLEVEDTNHTAQYDYQITFAFQVKEVVGVESSDVLIDANPEDGTNPRTGRKIIENIDAKFA